MASSLLTTAERTVIDSFASPFRRWPTSYRDWCEIITIPAVPRSEFYYIEDSARPRFSLDGTGPARIAVAKTTANANLMWIHYNIEISVPDMVAARASGAPLLEQTITEGVNKIDFEIERALCQGIDAEEGAVLIAGLMDSGQAVTTADLWDTAAVPVIHAAAGVLALNNYGYKEPFNWIMSLNLKPGLQRVHNAASDLSSGGIAKTNNGIANVYYAANGASTDLICKPLPAATGGHDGVWIMVPPKNKENFRIAEAFRPTVKMDLAATTKDNMFYGRIDWMGTVQIPRPKSIAYHAAVNLA